MTEEELKVEAKRLGYAVVKKPCYQCSCHMPYPNINHKHKNGNWKCVDKYRPIKHERKYGHQPMTKCVRIDGKGQNEDRADRCRRTQLSKFAFDENFRMA